jgi:hypothetical protein
MVLIGAGLSTIAALRLRHRRLAIDKTADTVRTVGVAMLCQKARQQSSIELKAKLSSGVLLGAHKIAAEQVLRERGDI